MTTGQVMGSRGENVTVSQDRFSCQGVALKLDLVGVVHQAVQNGIGQGLILHGVVPGLDRKLAGNDRGPAVVAFSTISQQFPLSLRKGTVVQ